MSRVTGGRFDDPDDRDPLKGVGFVRPITAAERQRLGPEGVRQEIEDRLQKQATFLDGLQAQLIGTATTCLQQTAGTLGGAERCIQAATLKLADSIRQVQRRLRLPIEQQALARIGELREFLQMLPVPKRGPLTPQGTPTATQVGLGVTFATGGGRVLVQGPSFDTQRPEPVAGRPDVADEPDVGLPPVDVPGFPPGTEVNGVTFLGGETEPPPGCGGPSVGDTTNQEGTFPFGGGRRISNLKVEGYVRYFCFPPELNEAGSLTFAGVIYSRSLHNFTWNFDFDPSITTDFIDYVADRSKDFVGDPEFASIINDWWNARPGTLARYRKQTGRDPRSGPDKPLPTPPSGQIRVVQGTRFDPDAVEEPEEKPCPETEDCFKLVPCDEATKECEPCPEECPSECPEDEDQSCLWVNAERKECTIRAVNTESPGEGWELLFCSVDIKQVERASDLICDTGGREFCLWLKVEERRCLILPQGEQPDSSGWELIECSGDLKLLREKEDELCGREGEPPREDKIDFNLESLITACKSQDLTAIFQSIQGASLLDPHLISKLFGLRNNKGVPTPFDFPKESFDIAGEFKQFILEVNRLLTDSVGWVLSKLVPSADVATAQMLGLDTARTLMQLSKYITGDVGADWSRPLDYARASIAQTKLTTADQDLVAFLGNEISLEELQKGVERNDICWDPYKRYAEAQRSKFGPLELQALWLRKEITTEEFDERIRQLGYLEGNEAERFRFLSNQIPPMSELLRYLVRDVGDDDLVKKFGMDEDFTEKWTGKLKEMGEKQGIGEEFARFSWRAHWSIPAPGQLFRMFHRLRNLPDTDEKFVDETIIEEAMKQQDILPFWIPKLLAISFNPLTRRDARRAYQIGVIDDEQLKTAFLDIGNSDENAEVLVDFSREQRRRQWRNLLPVKQYRDNLIPRREAEAELLRLLVPEDETAELLGQAQSEAETEVTKVCLRGIKKRFDVGEVDNVDARIELMALRLDPDQIDRVIRQWECLRTSEGKTPATNQLCEWLDMGTITQFQFLQRLKTIGWSVDDADNILLSCTRKLDARERKRMEQEQRKDEAEQRRKDRELGKQRKAIKRAQEKLLKAGDRAAAARDRREKRTLQAASKFFKCGLLDFESSVLFARAQVSRLKEDFALTPDEYSQAVLLASEHCKGQNIPSLLAMIDSIAEALEGGQSVATTDDGLSAMSENGEVQPEDVTSP